ncbi:MAG: YihY/virulence factor BrkB family protein [Oligoflexales bacterium]
MVDWKQIVLRVKDDITEDDISIVAAGVAFYFFLSVFPLLLAIVSIYGLAASPVDIERHLDAAFKIIPAAGGDIIKEQLQSIVSKPRGALGWNTALSILAALWTASYASSGLITGFNIAYDEKDDRGYIRSSFEAVVFTLIAALFFIAAIVCIAVLPVVFKLIGLEELKNVAEGLRWLVVLVIIMAAMGLANRYAPTRRPPQWKWVSVGSLVGTVLWLLTSFGFSYYVTNFGNYNETYGSITGIIILMLWLYITAYVLLLSAEINAEIEQQTRADSTVGKPKPMGQRGAVKADTLPSHQ